MTDRTQLIAEAHARYPHEFTPEALEGPGRLDGSGDRPLAQALDILIGEGWADEDYGSEPTVSRVGRFLYMVDDQGFVEVGEYESVEAADARALEVTRIEDQSDDD